MGEKIKEQTFKAVKNKDNRNSDKYGVSSKAYKLIADKAKELKFIP